MWIMSLMGPHTTPLELHRRSRGWSSRRGSDLRLEVMHLLDFSIDWSLTAKCLARFFLGFIGINLKHLLDKGFGFLAGPWLSWEP